MNHRSRFESLLSLSLTCAACIATVQAGEPTVKVGLQKQLLVDDWVIGQTSGVARQLHPAKKANEGQPIRFWTTNTNGEKAPLKAWIYATPYYDAERQTFRMWSRVWLDGQNLQYGYSESADGINFEFKSILTGLQSRGDYNSVAYIDPHESEPAHRYKIGYDGAQQDFPNGATLAHSADGIHWTPYNQGQPVTGRAADTSNSLIWDEAAQTYRLYTRTDFGEGGGAGEIRGLRSMINPDVKNNPTAWQTTSEWKFDKEGPNEHSRRQIYSMTDWIHDGIHFGLFAVYEWPNDFSEGQATDHVRRHERDVLNYYLATSRNGDDWDLNWIYSGQPLVERGGEGAWDKDMIFPANRIVTKGDQHYIYYGGANERHGTDGIFQPQRDFAMGVATLPLDRFVGLQANERGVIETKPFELAGPLLNVNLAASEGRLRVEILDKDGDPIPEYAMADAQVLASVDSLRLRPRWAAHDDLSALVGQTIRLRLYLENATLYAFQVFSVPEPHSSCLMGAGAIALLFKRKG